MGCVSCFPAITGPLTVLPTRYLFYAGLAVMLAVSSGDMVAPLRKSGTQCELPDGEIDHG